MISATHLVRRFGPLTAVDDISFELDRGEVVGFLGPNGAGKSTTMKMLTGYLPATRGSIEVAGFDVLTQSLEVRKRIGYLPEAVPLYNEHRVEEMLLFQGRLHGLTRKNALQRAAIVLDQVGMGERRRSLIGKLSKGQRQRVGLAVALLPDPEVLILDEPTSGLDPLQRLEVRHLLADLAQDRTVLLSSHILPEVEAVCPRVIILHRGKIVADGTQTELVGGLGGEAFVAVEAVLLNVEEALRLIGTLPGVTSVENLGKLGIHTQLRVFSDGDVREDVGALAAVKGWALRELSWSSPTLEQLFARLALELEDAEESPASKSAPEAATQQVSLGLELEMAPEKSDIAPEQKKEPFTLNPFQLGSGPEEDCQ